MSSEYYENWWIVTKEKMANLQQYDKFMKTTTKKAVKDRVRAGYLASGVYCRYCMIVQQLAVCLDQLFQFQKNVTIRKLMDAAVTRLNELKDQLTTIDMSEIHYVDGALIELKLVPYDIEVLDSAYCYPRPVEIEDMWERIQKGEKLFIPPLPPTPPPEEQQLDEFGHPIEAAPPEEEKPPEPQLYSDEEEEIKDPKAKKKGPKKSVVDLRFLTPEELEAYKLKQIRDAIVIVIQNAERARQSRLYYLDCARIKKANPNPDKISKRNKGPDPKVLESAAIGFQKLWRGHRDREMMKRRERQRKLMIGMTEPSWKSPDEKIKLQQNREKRQKIAKQHVKDYIKANLDEKERVLRVVGPGLMEDIGDEIREWFHQWFLRAKNFDKIPPAEKGGTVLVVRCETFTPEEYLEDVERKRREKEKAAGGGAKQKEKEKADKKKKELEKKKKEEEQKKKEAERLKNEKKEFKFKFEDTPAGELITEAFKEYKRMWAARTYEDNPEGKVYMDLINDEKCYEMQLEVRAVVDELMRVELDMLNDARAYDIAIAKGKKPKKKKRGRSKAKKEVVKKSKDPTANRTTEDLFQELVDNGIIHTYPVTHLEDFRGDVSFLNWDRRVLEFDPQPALGDVRQTIALRCILPMGCGTLLRPRSVLIVGPRQCGKHLLANAIFTETQCVLFDLSPPILGGKYEGKDMKMLIHLINKMSRLLQPSIIFMDGGEKPFYKKVPKPERKFDPKKMGKLLFKGIVKSILPEDRVMVLAITNQPWAGKPAGIKKAYETIIMVPRTDYGSAFMYWRELLMPYHGIDRDIDLTSLARFSVNFPLGMLKDFVEKVMTPRRRLALCYKPLQQAELYDLLISSKAGPVTDKEFLKFIKWYKKTPIGKEKAKYMLIVDKIREQEAKLAAKAAEKAAQAKNKK